MEAEAQAELARQKDQIQQLRREKSALQEKLAAAQGSSTHTGGARYGPSDPRREFQVLTQKTNEVRRRLDKEQSANLEKRNNLKNLLEKKDDLMADSQPLLTEGSELAQRIRHLENRLDKALIKHNEAVSIRRTYEDILKRLESERVGYDNQLAAIEKTLKAKEHDYQQLDSMAKEASFARTTAVNQVLRFRESYAAERAAREQEMSDRHNYVKNQFAKAMKQEKQAKMIKEKEEAALQAKREEEERQKAMNMQSTAELRTEEEEEKQKQLSAAYRRIRDVTRAVNVDAVISMFAAQRDTYASLAANKEEIERQIEELQITRAELRRKLDDAKYSGTGNMGSRRIVDDFEAHLTEARALLAKTTKDFERISNVFMGVRAGVEHLNEKLSHADFRADLTAPSPVSESNIKDALEIMEQKLSLLMEAAAAEVDSAAAQLANADFGMMVMPENNRRVEMRSLQEEEMYWAREAAKNESQIADHEDDPHDRTQLKRMSESALEREKSKKKLRREGEN